MNSVVLHTGVDAYQRTLLGSMDRRYLSQSTAKIALLAVVGICLVIPSYQAVRKINKTEKTVVRAGGEKQSSALGRWMPTLTLAADRQDRTDLYGFGHWFPTPPFVLMAMSPLSAVNFTAAAVIWAIIKILAFAIGMSFLLRTLAQFGYPVPLGVLALAAVFSLRPVISDLQHANLNIFVIAWIAIAWALYLQKRDMLCGLFVALAIVTKVTPALLLVYFAYKRAWKVCAGTVVGLVLVFFVIPGLYFGFDRNTHLLTSWFNMLVAPYALHGYATVEIANQSLYGTLLRVLSNAGWLNLQFMSGAGVLGSGMEYMARPDSAAGQMIRTGVTLGVLGSLAWLCRTRGIDRRDPRMMLELSLVLIAMLLMGERTWKHHATTLPIVFIAQWYVLTHVDWPSAFRKWFLIGLAVQFLTLVAGSEGLVGDDLAERLLDGGIFCWGLLLCGIQIAVLLRKLQRGPAFASVAP